MKKILILNDGSQYENWGIKACVDGLENIFLSKQQYVFEKISHESMHRKFEFNPKIFGKQLFTKNNRFAKKFIRDYHVIPQVADEFEYVADLWMAGKGGPGAREFFKKVRDVDAVVFNAEGSTYRKNIGAIKGLFMLWFAKNRLHKKSFFLNGSVTLTLVDAVLPAMIKKVFSEIDLVGVRELYSQKNIIDFYPSLSEKIYVYPDSVFTLRIDFDKNAKINCPDGDFFVFSKSMLPMDFSMTREKSSIVSLIRELKKVVPNAVLLAKDTEDQFLKEVAEITDSYFVGPEHSYFDVMRLFSRAQFAISGRYHHLIFATKVGCPCIPLTTSSQKIHGLSALFEGIMPNPVDATDLWTEKGKIVELAKSIITNSKTLKDRYLHRANQLELQAFSQMKKIDKIIRNIDD